VRTPPGSRLAGQRLRDVAVNVDTDLEIVLEPGVLLSGRVTDPHGVPAGGIWVTALDRSDPSTYWEFRIIGDGHTDAEGAYRIRLMPGTRDLWLTAQPGDGSSMQPQVLESVEISAQTDLDLVLEPRVRLSGRITDAAGRGVYPCTIRARLPGRGLYDQRAAYVYGATDGAYELSLLRGVYDLLVIPFSWDGAPVSQSGHQFAGIEVAADQPLDVELAVPDQRFTLWGKVAGDTGNFYLEAFDPSTGCYQETEAEADGTYRLPLPPGNYDLSLSSLYSFGRLRGRIQGVSVSADREYNLEADAETITAILEEAAPTPAVLVLHPNHPNPFNAGTLITYESSQVARVHLAAYNLLGQRVRLLVNSTEPAGSHSVSWDGTDDRGQPLASGVYSVRLQSGGAIRHQRALLLR
jgi:hypothetical protein